MSRWFRHYSGTMRDPKFVGVAVRCKQPIERVLFVWGCILESAAEKNNGGQFSVEAPELAYFLRCEDSEIEKLLGDIEQTGLTSNGSVVQWKTRQYESDSSTERSRKHREGKRNSDATLQDRCATPPETETETDTKTERKIDSRAVASATRPPADEKFEEFKKAFPKRRGANPSKPARDHWNAAIKRGADPDQIIAAVKAGVGFDREKVGTEFSPRMSTWLSERRYEDHETNVVPMARNGFYAAFGSAELEAWSQFERTNGKTTPRDRHGGWEFPSRWPPGHDPPQQATA